VIQNRSRSAAQTGFFSRQKNFAADTAPAVPVSGKRKQPMKAFAADGNRTAFFTTADTFGSVICGGKQILHKPDKGSPQAEEPAIQRSIHIFLIVFKTTNQTGRRNLFS
jgi:hypothetical protein